MKKRLSLVCLSLVLVLCFAMIAQAGELVSPFLDSGKVFVELAEPWDMEAAKEVLDGAFGITDTEQITVQTLSEALMLLTSGRADVFLTFYDTALYIASRNEGMTAIEGIAPVKTSLCIIGETSQADNMPKLNAAIEAMVADGTIDALWNEHVMAVIDGAEPVTVSMPVMEGADTIVVGISGDCPPIDYTTADGNPAGFNTALLAELAQRTNLNIEVKQVDSGARFLSMISGEINFFFWQANRDKLLEADGLGNGAEDRLSAITSISDQFIISVPYHEVVTGSLQMVAE